MKKFGLLSAFLAIGLLASCGGGGEGTSQGDPAAEARAIELAKQQNIAFVSRSVVLINDITTEIGHDGSGYYNNDYLYLATSQKVLDKESGNDYTVNIEWKYDETDPFVAEKRVNDDTHISIYFNYSKTDEHEFPFTATFTCGSAAASTFNYKVKLLLKNLEFEELRIADIYAPTEANDDFKLVNQETGYWRANNDDDKYPYALVQVTGHVIYVSPDGNWGLIGDGTKVLEIYSGSASDLKPDKYPALVVGNCVKVYGELSSYYGNTQTSFIFDIVPGDASKIDAWAGYTSLSGTQFSGKHYWEDYLTNATRTVNAVFKGNIVQNSSVVQASALTNGRFTFDVEVDGVKMQVAYDYHVDRDGSKGIFDAYKAKLQSLSVGSSLTIKGTVRFVGTASKGFKGNKTATDWSIVPFLADHMA